MNEDQLLRIIKAQSDCIHAMWNTMQNLTEQLDGLITEDVSKALISMNKISEPEQVDTISSFVQSELQLQN